MAEHNELGKKGEELALLHLKSLNYEILATNYKAGRVELDIVARDGQMLVVVEVKTRGSAFFGEPEAFVSRQKQRAIIRAANHFIERKNFFGETRFDIVSIIVTPKGNQLNHIKDAFYPLV